jgi:response regulator RpfG family c-di-GMP phosphodiesterase
MRNGAVRVLLVDDDEDDYVMTRDLLAEIDGVQYELAWQDSYAGALEAIVRHEHDVYLLDYRLGERTGLELLRDAIARGYKAPMILLTGQGDRAVDLQAMKLGAADFLVKGRLDASSIERSIRYAIERYQAKKEIDLSREETIVRLARAAEARDHETGWHIQRMSRYCALLAEQLGFEPDHCELIRLASIMHDVGKIGIPDKILLKPGRLTPNEFSIMKQHADIGHRILQGSNAELLKAADIIAWTHHEKYDGSGYPRGLDGDEIPIEGRIAAVADVFDALTSQRVYKPAYPFDQALEIMREGRGHHFDPNLLDLFLASTDQLLQIKDQYADREDLDGLSFLSPSFSTVPTPVDSVGSNY